MGPFHEEAKDRERDAWPAQQGFRVLRFKNAEVGIEGPVVSAILDATAASPAGIDV